MSFALTEPGAGSDRAHRLTLAALLQDKEELVRVLDLPVPGPVLGMLLPLPGGTRALPPEARSSASRTRPFSPFSSRTGRRRARTGSAPLPATAQRERSRASVGWA